MQLHLQKTHEHQTRQDAEILSDKLKTLHLYYHNDYGHKNYRCANMLQGAPTHKFAWHLSEVIIWGHATN